MLISLDITNCCHFALLVKYIRIVQEYQKLIYFDHVSTDTMHLRRDQMHFYKSIPHVNIS